MEKPSSSNVQVICVDESHEGQRIDNFLFTRLKGVPKSRIYKAIRKGEVRVNKKRVKPEYKLSIGDQIRLPPLRVAAPAVVKGFASQRMGQKIEQRIIFEDPDFIIINKPAGMAVHGGSGISLGVIEALRQARSKQKFLELVHRLDRETSGCLLIAKKSSALKEVHKLLLERSVEKRYLLLVAGHCDFQEQVVDVALKKNVLKSGERIVLPDSEGKSAKTIFRRIKYINDMTLLEAKPITGRTHQIRVHARYLGFPILGDDKYGDDAANKKFKARGYHQLCLHSSSLAFYLEAKKQGVGVCALLLEPWAKLVRER
jgi:23S rRNA pseudouridine955/2504/2580 synthase